MDICGVVVVGGCIILPTTVAEKNIQNNNADHLSNLIKKPI